MTHEEILRERVAKLEVQMAHLSEKLDDTHKKVEEMHAILLQAKGARWVIVGLAGVAGLASGLVAKRVYMPSDPAGSSRAWQHSQARHPSGPAWTTGSLWAVTSSPANTVLPLIASAFTLLLVCHEVCLMAETAEPKPGEPPRVRGVA